MKPAILATTIASLLVVASVAGIALVNTDGAPDLKDALTASTDSHAGADEARIEHGHAGDGPHAGQPGMERPSWPEAVGSTPTADDAQSMEQVSSLRIRDDSDFTPATGVRSGNGTLDDPYIISGYHVTGDLYIADTDACFIVRENYIGGQLTLNWNGQCVWAHHNYIEDLRVNENVKRTGFATGGLIELNKIEFIGQIRHYDGEFRHNLVGPRGPDSMFDEVLETTPLLAPDLLVANVDGFNQGLFHHNTFHGSVDLDLHGHHHGTGFFAPHSHYHGSNGTKAEMHPHDHTQRWTSVKFVDNKVIDPDGYGLRYEDRNHAGDDRTARSEDEEMLDEPHRHYTHIVIARNEVTDAGIWVDVFNADDDRHYDRNPGTLEVVDNVIDYKPMDREHMLGIFYFGGGGPFEPTGLMVQTAKEVQLVVTGNRLSFTPNEEQEDPTNPDLLAAFGGEEPDPAAIRLGGIKDSRLTLQDNVFDGFYYGIYARQFDSDVAWNVSDNQYGDAQYPVWYDDSVESQPQGDDV